MHLEGEDILKLRRLISMLLCVLMIAGLAIVAVVSTSAAETETAETGALGRYHNVNYLESEAKAYLSTQKDKTKTDLGANYTPSKTTWNVWAPSATKVQLKLYATGSDMESGAAVLGKYDMTFTKSTGVWSIAKSGDFKNVYYTYIITTSAGTNETYDIYAKACGVNGDRSMVVDLDSTDPDGWDKDEHVFHSQTDAIIWEVQIADVTANSNSGVDAQYQGKYLGFAQGGLTLNGKGSISTGIDYLVEQGVNTVHLMPLADFASGDETGKDSYNWGYDPKNYNVPDGLYSTNPYDGNVRIKEYKQLVQALHDRGISVVMDVVYNHTYVTEQSAFTYTVPGYYYRMSSSTFYINGTGCGNTTASDKAMFNSYMMQSLRYWVEEYHIDGFRFDIMGAHDYQTMNEIRAMFNSMYDGKGSNIIMYGEPWAAGATGLDGGNESTTANISKISSNIGGFNGGLKLNFIGAQSGTSKGWLQGNSVPANARGLRNGVVGTYGKYPNQSINYGDCHDGCTLWDIILMSQGAAKAGTEAGFNSTDAKYTSQLKTGLAYLMTSQGVPFIQSGSEFARTKLGNGNSYNLGALNALDWTRVQTYSNVVEYSKGLRQIRAAYSPFRASETKNSVTWLSTSSDNSVLAYQLNNNKSGEWSSVVVAFNNGAAGSVTLPSGTWTVIANGEKAGLASLGTASGTYNIGAYSSAILVQGSTTAKAPQYGTLTVNHYEEDGTLIKTSTVKYAEGTTWRASADAYTIFDHNVSKIENSAGTKDGTTVYGTVTAGQKVTVSYYYKAFNTSNYLTVKFVDEKGADVAAPITYRLLNGLSYNVPFKNVLGYELISSKYPTNFKGTFDAAKPPVVTFVYRALDNDSITVYYYRSSALGNGTLRMYAYTEAEEKPLGDWDNALQNMELVKDASELPAGETTGNWYKKVINSSNNQLDYMVQSCKVMFLTSGSGKQEPLNGEAGYEAAGTIYVKNKIVTFNAKVITSHIDANTGKKLAEDVVVDYNNVTSNEVYVTSAKSELGKAVTPANASGNLIAGSTCVVYMYDTSGENPTDPKPTIPQPTGPVEGGIILGDADLNGTVNVKDATLVQKVSASLAIFSEKAERAADADGNGSINVKDATAIQKYVAGIQISYKVGEIIEGTGTVVVTPTVPDNTKPEESSNTDELIKLYNTASALLKDKADYVVEKPIKGDELAKKADYGFDVALEDTTKNEYDKFETVLKNASFYVVYGGTDEEVANATDELKKAYDWFDYFVTSMHTSPVTTGGGTGGGSITVYFSNNKGWSSVNAYTWDANNTQYSGAWPGTAMTFEKENDYGEKIYSFAVPEGAEFIIFTNGTQQTVDISLEGIANGTGFYLDGTPTANKFNYGTYEYQ